MTLTPSASMASLDGDDGGTPLSGYGKSETRNLLRRKEKGRHPLPCVKVKNHLSIPINHTSPRRNRSFSSLSDLSIKNGMNHELKQVQFFSLDLTHWHEVWQFSFLAIVCFVSFWLCGYFEEYIFTIDNFDLGWFLTSFELFFFAFVTGVPYFFNKSDQSAHASSRGSSRSSSVAAVADADGSNSNATRSGSSNNKDNFDLSSAASKVFKTNSPTSSSDTTHTDKILADISSYLRSVWSRVKPVSPLRIHVLIGLAMMGSRSLTIFSLIYINYPTQVIFKSLKLLSVLVGSVWCFKKSYSSLEVLGHVSMVVSALCFTLGDAQTSSTSQTPSDTLFDASDEIADISGDAGNGADAGELGSKFTAYGIVLVSLSLVADSVHANYQEYALKVLHSTMSELMIFSNLIAAIIASFACVMSQEWIDAIYYLRKHPDVMYLILMRSLCIFCGAVAYLALTKRFGAVMASEVTTARKVVTIVTSYLLFPKPFIFKHQIGAILFALAVGLNVYAKRRADRNKPNSGNSESGANAGSTGGKEVDAEGEV